MNHKMLYNCAVYGILTVIVGTVVGGIVGMFLDVNLPPVCESWNDNMVMEVSLFLTGAVVCWICQTYKLV